MYSYAVTGSGGFIGGHLLKALEGQKVLRIPHVILSNKSDLHKFFLSNFTPDVIIHLSAYGNMTFQKDEQEMKRVNIDNLLNLLQVTKYMPYKAFINVSTSSVNLSHQTLYSATKASGEAICKAFVDEYKKPIVTIRPYSVYGEGEADFRFIPTVFRSCLLGEEMRLAQGYHDWIYVKDIVNFIVNIVPQANKYLYDCGTGVQTSNQGIVDIIENITGKETNMVRSKPMRSFDTQNWASSNPLQDTISLKEGLRRCYPYYLKRYAKRNI